MNNVPIFPTGVMSGRWLLEGPSQLCPPPQTEPAHRWILSRSRLDLIDTSVCPFPKVISAGRAAPAATGESFHLGGRGSFKMSPEPSKPIPDLFPGSAQTWFPHRSHKKGGIPLLPSVRGFCVFICSRRASPWQR